MSFIEQYLLQLNTEKRRWRHAVMILTVLSFIVTLVTVWNLRMTGITVANGASCGFEEHQHTEECTQAGCTKEEHIHSTDCYSNPTADVETALDWQEMFADYPYTGNLRTDLVGVAKMQVGYTESRLNFEMRSDGIKRGYTRYGAWYGAPYNDWSAIFVSFCLNFAHADGTAFPRSSGADTMAQLWEKQEKFASAGSYVPQSGDLVFFNDNTVGIVAEVYHANLHVIRGDAEDAVKSEIISLQDEHIVGWGITEAKESAEQTPTPSPAVPQSPEATEKPEQTEEKDPFTDGPIVQIYEGGESVSRPSTYSLRKTRSVIELLPYLEANGGGYFFTLLDRNNMELPKDDDGNYIVQANANYKLTVSFTSPLGFMPGTYQYQIPNGLMVDGGEGEFILKDGTNVGAWSVTDTGLITLVFNENMNSRSDITISATLGINFPEQDSPIDFDGFISVKVEPPAPQISPTVLSKWGSPDEDAKKIHWTVRIDGHADSQIPGSILTDQPALSDWSRPHSYTQSDIDGGLTFGVSDPAGGWHSWHVSPDDPHLVWDETGWSYKIPKTVTCAYCGELELGNDGWIYLVDYTSTPTPLNTPGTFDYENKVTVDGQTAWGWSNFNHGEIEAVIEKSGAFVSDAAGGGFLWEFQVTIPGRPEGQRAEYSWFVMDEMRLLNDSGVAVGIAQNDAHLSTVTAVYNGELIRIPRIQDATDKDMFAWDNAWTATENGISYNRTINLLCRCQCTPESCRWGGCGEYWYRNDAGNMVSTREFCQCWTENQNMTFTFVYRTEDLSTVEGYGALGYQINNHAQLYYMPESEKSVRVSYDDATVTIPNLFEKQLTHDFNGYTAHYKITVNEAKLVLTNGTPLTIRDVMTDSLAYISGSLVITTENAVGHISQLQQGVDFTVKYDGTDADGKHQHVLNIVILKPQPVKYILDYDTTLIMPDQVTGGIKYSNTASISLWGTEIEDDAVEKVYADINIAAKSYKVDMFKTCALTGKALPGATFGLFNAQGGLIATGVTDAQGRLSFQTNITDGIVLREHVLYYLQEMRPPPAYRLDDTRHWFCFCSGTGNSCMDCENTLEDLQGFRIPFEQVGIVDIANYPANVILPATGGRGTSVYIQSGLVLVIGTLVCGFGLRRKRERRLK